MAGDVPPVTEDPAGKQPTERRRRMLRWPWRSPTDQGSHAGRDAAEWPIVVIMVSAAMLSTVAFWQATQMADEASRLTNQARFADIQGSQYDSAVEARLAHDRHVLARCKTAIERRDAALARYSQLFGGGMASAFAESEQVHVALRPLLLADPWGDCSTYSVTRALELADFTQSSQVGFGNPGDLMARAGPLTDSEHLAVIAAVAFAFVLLATTLADAASTMRWVRRWLILAIVGILFGLGFAATAFVRVGEVPLAAVWTVVSLSVLMAVVGIAVVTWDRRPRAWRLERLPRWKSGANLAMRLGLKQPMRVWAEILGAMALIAFALAVLGYSTSTARERERLAAADALAFDARAALEIGQESALTTLSFAVQLSEIDARVTGAVQGPVQESTVDVTADQVTRDALLGDIWMAELGAWHDILASRFDDTEDEGCFDPDATLAWDVAPALSDRLRAQSLPEDLLAAYREDPYILREMIHRSSSAAAVCLTLATVNWDKAEGWSNSASLFTIALVALGLAGFLFALASDADRTPRPRAWLFAAGIIGMIAGAGVSFAAGTLRPAEIPEADLKAGAQAHVAAVLDRAVWRCTEANEAASAATSALADFAPARLAQAEAAYCDPREEWLIFAARDPDGVDAYISHLLEARDAGLDADATNGSLGWATTLRAMRNGMNDVDGEALAQARRLNDQALEHDPSNPNWCFNAALLERINGSESAIGAYEEALAGLAADDDDDGPGCGGIGLDHPELRTLMRLSALADLELLGEPGAHDEIRNRIVASEPVGDQPVRCPTYDPAADPFVAPASVRLGGIPDSSGDPVSLVWYYRPSADQTWAVMGYPSSVTIRPGCHAGLSYAVARILPEGEYRVDVYVDGLFVHRAIRQDGWWEQRDLASADFKHVHLVALGISVVVPTDWSPDDGAHGAEAAYVGAGGQVAIQRREGADADGLLTASASWANGWLEEWGLDSLAAEDVGTEPNAHGFLGLQTTHGISVREGLTLGLGHSQYLTKPVDSPLLTDVKDTSCPGAALSFIVAVDELPLVDVIWESLLLVSPPHTVWTEHLAASDQFTGSVFAADVPVGWAAAACPANLVAESPDALTAIYVTSISQRGTLGSIVAAIRQEQEAAGEISEPVERVLSDGTPALELVVTSGSADAEVHQVQLYALTGGRLIIAALTTAEALQDVEEELDLLYTTLVPIAPIHFVTAECAECSEAELIERQVRLDEMGSLTAAIDDTSCRDVSDSAGSGVGASIGCSWPDGVQATFTLWEGTDRFLEERSGAEQRPGATVLEWHFGDEADTQGLTAEWTEGGTSTIFWTYDADLVTVQASLAGEQTELKSWWGETGARSR